MKRLTLIIIMIPICMLIFNIPYYEEHFNHEYNCIRYVNGENTFDNIDVNIKGTISRYLNNEDDVIRYTLCIGDVEYPNKGKNIAIYPYWPKSKTERGIYTAGKLQYTPTDKIERELEYRENNYEILIQYSYFDTNKIDSSHIHNGFINLEKDYSNICIGLFPEDSYDAEDFPKGIITIVSAPTFDEAKKLSNEFWKTLM